MNTQRIKQRIQQQIKKMPTSITFYRNKKNDFGEPDGLIEVTTIEALYYTKTSRINLNTNDAGVIETGYVEFLLTIDVNVSLLKSNDFFTFKNIKYKIAKIFNNYDTFYDIQLERV